MAITTRSTLKGYFNTGDKPTESNFADLIDSSAETRIILQTEDTNDVNYSSDITTSTNIFVNAAMASGKDIKLPEATPANGGMVIKIFFAVAPAAQCNIGYAGDTDIVGGATAIGADTEGNAAGDVAFKSSAKGDGNHSIELDIDAAAKACGQIGTVLEFVYPGIANTVFYKGYCHSDVDSATLATHFVTTQL